MEYQLYEGVTIYTLEGELLDYIGKTVDWTLVRDLIAIAGLASNGIDASKPIEISIDYGIKRLIIFIDPPIVRVGIALTNGRRELSKGN